MADTDTVNAHPTEDTKIDEISYQLVDITLTALTCGDKDHQVVLCLHGYLDNAASFLPLMKEGKGLTNKYIVALEWPGHGHSDHRSVGAHYHFLDYVSDLVALFVVNDWPAIDIVAHSMGAMVASAFAAAFPEKVKSLTLIDSIGFICESAEQTTQQLRKGMLSRSKPIKPLKSTRSFSAETAVKARLHVSDLQNKHAELIVQRSLIKTALADNKIIEGAKEASLYRWRSDPRLRTISPYRLTLAQGQQLLSDIQCPVQLIYGDKGMAMVAKNLPIFSPYLTTFSTVELKGGHHVHMENPMELSTLLNSYIHYN